jgi:hypothetical protein
VSTKNIRKTKSKEKKKNPIRKKGGRTQFF